MRDTFLVLILGPEKVSFISEVYFIDKTASRRAWHLPGRWPEGGRRSTVARWTRRRAAPAYALTPDPTWPTCMIFRNVLQHFRVTFFHRPHWTIFVLRFPTMREILATEIVRCIHGAVQLMVHHLRLLVTLASAPLVVDLVTKIFGVPHWVGATINQLSRFEWKMTILKPAGGKSKRSTHITYTSLESNKTPNQSGRIFR